MIYQLLKPLARIYLKIACRNIKINDPEKIKCNGPLLLACNHPNSFLDGLILAILFDYPVHSLARGDAFRKKWHAKLLYLLKIHPVYREREGKELVPLNYTTFKICKEIFKEKGIVLIFSEALCVNEWKLRPLRKGTARMAFDNWNENIPLTVLPVGINYDSFDSFGKNIILNFGKDIKKENFDFNNSDGKNLVLFNQLLQEALQKAVIHIEPSDTKKVHQTFFTPVSPVKKIILAIPALIGFILHLPLFFPAKTIVKYRAFNTGHYDSILAGVLFLSYPFYLLLLALFAFIFTHSMWSLLLIPLLPFTAWSVIQLKPQS
ncbi:MAG: 1-acyl-sn-glycerol-3-phosphate acyltransferase [Sphingobacteriales bacterium]|nr:1-acyl-sn-glycerol-3-phosphate acyltransferase [Sphingobacteriales bacterium]